MLVRNPELGASSRQDTRTAPVALIARSWRRGRRPIVREAVFPRDLHRGQRPLESEALRLGQGQVMFLNEEEARQAARQIARSRPTWELWEAKALTGSR